MIEGQKRVDIRDFIEKGDDSNKKIRARFEAITELLDPYQEVVTKYYKNKDGLINLLKFVHTNRNELNKIDTINLEDRTIIFKDKQNKKLQVPYICIKYIDGFTRVKDSINRYSYFEIYSKVGILSVIMRQSRFAKKKQELMQFDLNNEEWRQAVKQLELWEEYIVSLPETIEYNSKTQEYLEEYFDGITDENIIEQEMFPLAFALVDKPRINIQDESTKLLVDTWALLSYMTMIQVLPAIGKKNDSYPYLNLIVEQFENGLENSFKEIASKLSLRNKKVKDNKIVISDDVQSLEVSKITNLPKIMVAENIKVLSRALLFLSEKNDDVNRFNRAADYYPILISNNWIIDYRYIDYEIKIESVARLARDTDLLKTYRKVIDYNLANIFEERFLSWEDYCDKLNKKFKGAYKACRKWWKTNGISMLPDYYIDLLAWFSITVLDEEKYSFEGRKNNVIDCVKESIINIDADLFKVLNSYKGLLSSIYDIPQTDIVDMPSSKEEVDSLDYPVCVVVSGEEIVLFTDLSIQKFVKQHSRNLDHQKFIKLCRQRMLLKTGKDSSITDNKTTYQFKIDSPDDKKRYGKKVFQFVKNNIKLFLKKVLLWM